jgi:uncharacterized SAM-dependent methyltransferase
VGEYFPALEEIPRNGNPRLLMFMGSTIGNARKAEAGRFVKKLTAYMEKGDFFLLGVDLKKDPRIILSAYNDSAGVTREFNLNLLGRVNRELDGNFDLDGFDHYASYDPISGAATSYLVSLSEQIVTVGEYAVEIRKGEVIHTEVSMKYSEEEIEALGSGAGLELMKLFLDSREYYALALFRL